MLCPECDAVRFPRDTPTASAAALAAASTAVKKGTGICAKTGGTRKPAKSVSAADSEELVKSGVKNQSRREYTDTKSASKSSLSIPDEYCPICHEVAGELSLKCDMCSDVFHQECSGLSKKVFEVLLTIVIEAGWVCVDCRTENGNHVKTLQTVLTKTVEELADMRVSLGQLTAEVNKMKKVSNSDKNTNDAGTHTTAIRGAEDNHHSVTNESVRREVHKTLSDISRRKRNVVVTGLPEKSPSSEANPETDKELFTKLCEEHLPVKPSVIECKRLGKLNKTDNRPRRLLVHLTSEDCASDLLAAAKQLRRSDDLEIASTVYINPDLSPAEAELAYERRQKRRAARQKLVTPGRAPDPARDDEMLDCIAQCHTADGTGSGDSGNIISNHITGNVQPAQATALSHETVTTANTRSTSRGANSNTQQEQDHSAKSPFPSN